MSLGFDCLHRIENQGPDNQHHPDRLQESRSLPKLNPGSQYPHDRCGECSKAGYARGQAAQCIKPERPGNRPSENAAVGQRGNERTSPANRRGRDQKGAQEEGNAAKDHLPCCKRKEIQLGSLLDPLCDHDPCCPAEARQKSEHFAEESLRKTERHENKKQPCQRDWPPPPTVFFAIVPRARTRRGEGPKRAWHNSKRPFSLPHRSQAPRLRKHKIPRSGAIR